MFMHAPINHRTLRSPKLGYLKKSNIYNGEKERERREGREREREREGMGWGGGKMTTWSTIVIFGRNFFHIY